MRIATLRALAVAGDRHDVQLGAGGGTNRADVRRAGWQGHRRSGRRAAWRHRHALRSGGHGNAERGDRRKRTVSVPRRQFRHLHLEVRAVRLRAAGTRRHRRPGPDDDYGRCGDEARDAAGNGDGHRRVADRRCREHQDRRAAGPRDPAGRADVADDLRVDDGASRHDDGPPGSGRIERRDVHRDGRARRLRLQPELLRRHRRHARQLRVDVLHGLRLGRGDLGRHRRDGRGNRRRRRREHQRHPEVGRQPGEGRGDLQHHRQGLLERLHRQQHHAGAARPGHHRPDAAQAQ